MIKAQYSAAEAQVRIGEATTGLSSELSDIGAATARAQDQVEQMRARASAVEELVATGALDEVGAPGSSVARPADRGALGRYPGRERDGARSAGRGGRTGRPPGELSSGEAQADGAARVGSGSEQPEQRA